MAKTKTVLYDDETTAREALKGKPAGTGLYKITNPDGTVRYGVDRSASKLRAAASLDVIKVELLNPQRAAKPKAAVVDQIKDMTPDERAAVAQMIAQMAS